MSDVDLVLRWLGKGGGVAPQWCLLTAALAACAGPQPTAARRDAPAASAAASVAQVAVPVTRGIDPVGVWAGELVLGPTETGPVRLRKGAAGWEVDAMGQRGACAPPAAGQSLWACKLGESGHLLRTPVPADASAPLDAYWVSPEVQYVARGGYATSLRLVPDAAGAYVGATALVATRLVAAIGVGRRPTGELYASLREREQNLGRLLGVMAVTAQGDRLILALRDGQRLSATLSAGRDGQPERLDLPLFDSGLTLRLTRRRSDDALVRALWPAPGTAAEPLLTPAALDDGWPVASLEEAGVARAPLEQMAEELVRPPRDWSDLAVHHVVLAHRGRLVLDAAFAGTRPEEVHDLRSAGKSFTAALVGMAVDRGELGLDERVLDVLGATHADPRWRRMKVRHLLSMSSGLACDDEDAASPGNEDRMQEQAEPSWHRFALGVPMAREPGAAGMYCTAGLNLLGALLAKRWGGWLPQQLDERLARPLGIRALHQILMPDGQGYLGGGLRMSTRDAAKLGQLFVERGRWRGRRLLSERFVAQATAAHATLSARDDYGLGWWRTSFRVGLVDYPAFYASGNGGQLVIGLPSLGAVVAFTAGNYANRRAWQRILDELVPRYVIPALRGTP